MSESTQIGMQGLGYSRSTPSAQEELEVDGTQQALPLFPLRDDEMCPLPTVEWISIEEIVPAEDMRNWIVIGPRKLTIDDEVLLAPHPYLLAPPLPTLLLPPPPLTPAPPLTTPSPPFPPYPSPPGTLCRTSDPPQDAQREERPRW